MSFGDRLREARKSKGMSQQELADELGISINSVANYERGTSFPKESYLYKIINIFGLDPNYLFQDSVGIKTGYWFEEKMLLDNFRSLNKKSRFFVNYILEREAEKHIGEALKGKNQDIEFLCLDVTEGIYGSLCIGSDNEKIRAVKKSDRADFLIMVRGRGMEPVIFDGDILSIKYVADINENAWGLYNLDGYAVIGVKKRGKFVGLNGNILNTELLNRSPVLYGRVIEVHRMDKR